MAAKDRIIVALDVSDVEKACSLVKDLGPHVGCFKIGLQFINAMLKTVIVPDGINEAINNLKDIRFLFQFLNGNILWDGKFHDIPNTVAGASEEISEIEVKMFNVHASGSIEMMREAVANKGNSKVLAVTVLTSLSEDNAHLIYGAPSKAKVVEFARWAKLAGIDGLICSAQELEILGKQEELNELIKICPGIRPIWAQKEDQKRVMCPGEAIRAGADYLVIGRPITKPPEIIGSPVDAAKKIAQEIDEALSSIKEKGDKND